MSIAETVSQSWMRVPEGVVVYGILGTVSILRSSFPGERF